MPKVSVVMPVFNMQAYIRDSIQSILNQTFSDFELILVDDGSTDESCAIAAEFNDPRVVWISNPTNTGVAKAVNRGIEQSLGEYIALVAADDFLTKDSLGLRLGRIEGGTEDPYGLCCGQIIDIGEDTSLSIAYTRTKKSSLTRYFYGPANLIHRKVFEQWGLFDETLPYGSDREMWVRLFGLERERTDRTTFLCIPEVVGYYRVRPNSLQQVAARSSLLDKLKIKTKLGQAILSRLENVGPDIERLKCL